MIMKLSEMTGVFTRTFKPSEMIEEVLGGSGNGFCFGTGIMDQSDFYRGRLSPRSRLQPEKTVARRCALGGNGDPCYQAAREAEANLIKVSAADVSSG
jgi:hypothetical protein